MDEKRSYSAEKWKNDIVKNGENRMNQNYFTHTLPSPNFPFNFWAKKNPFAKMSMNE